VPSEIVLTGRKRANRLSFFFTNKIEWRIVMRIILILLLLTSVANAGPFFAIERGQLTDNADYTFTKMEVGYRNELAKGWFTPEVYGSWNTWTYKLRHPFDDIYTIGVKLRVKTFFMKWEHCCVHPVASSYNTIENEESKQVFKEWVIVPNTWGGNYDICSVGFEYEF
jgi:hypothetical protein